MLLPIWYQRSDPKQKTRMLVNGKVHLKNTEILWRKGNGCRGLFLVQFVFKKTTFNHETKCFGLKPSINAAADTEIKFNRRVDSDFIGVWSSRSSSFFVLMFFFRSKLEDGTGFQARFGQKIWKKTEQNKRVFPFFHDNDLSDLCKSIFYFLGFGSIWSRKNVFFQGSRFSSYQTHFFV